MKDNLEYIDQIMKDGMEGFQVNNVSQSWSNMQKKMQSRNLSPSPARMLYPIAATIIVIVAIFITYFYYHNSTQSNTIIHDSLLKTQPETTATHNKTSNYLSDTPNIKLKQNKLYAYSENADTLFRNAEQFSNENSDDLLILDDYNNDKQQIETSNNNNNEHIPDNSNTDINKLKSDTTKALKNKHSANELINETKIKVPYSDFSSSIKGCAPLEVDFMAKTKNANGYHWNFDDGHHSTLENPTYTFEEPGTYIVKLKADNNLVKGILVRYDTIIVYENPKALFKISPNPVLLPDKPIVCSNLSKNSTKFRWYFGDGEKSTKKNPSHIYSSAGQFDVALVACNNNQCCDSIYKKDAVSAKIVGFIKFPNALYPDLFGPNSGYYTLDNDNYNNKVFHPVHFGVIEYKLTVYERYSGIKVFETSDINIGWDGYDKNQKLCKPGVYPYVAIGKFKNGASFIRKGDITIIHK